MATSSHLVHLDLGGNEVQNARLQHLGSPPAAESGRFYLNTNTGAGPYILRYHTGQGWVDLVAGVRTLTDLDDVDAGGASVGKFLWHDGNQFYAVVFDDKVRLNRLDQMAAPTGPLSLAGQRLINLGAPTAGTDAVTKDYADQLRQGMDPKDSVRVATTADITLSGTQTIDGVAVVAGNRVLVKNQANAAQNGIYEVVAAGAWTRTYDADASGELSKGSITYVEEGAQGGTQWIVTDVGATPWAPGTASTWTQFQSGVPANYAGQNTITTVGTIGTGTWQGTPVAIAYGGTGATDAAGARTNLGATGKYATNIGDGAATSYTVTHNLNTRDVTVQVFTNGGSYDTVTAGVTRPTVNTVAVAFNTAPALNAYRCVVTG